MSLSDKPQKDDTLYQGMIPEAFSYQNERKYGLPHIPSNIEEKIMKRIREKRKMKKEFDIDRLTLIKLNEHKRRREKRRSLKS